MGLLRLNHQNLTGFFETSRAVVPENPIRRVSGGVGSRIGPAVVQKDVCRSLKLAWMVEDNRVIDKCAHTSPLICEDDDCRANDSYAARSLGVARARR